MAQSKESQTKPGATSGIPDFDLRKFFADVKLPALPDVESVLTAHRKNLDALSEANRTALEGAQAVAKRHMEILQQTTAELTEALRQLSVSTPPTERAAKHAELLKQAYEHGVANTRELSELIQKANTEALARLSSRFKELLDEMKTLFKKN